MGLVDDLKKSEAERTRPNMLQAIRTRFTSGRPRRLPREIIGPVLSVAVANAERDKIRDFIRERGEDPENYIVKVFVVTTDPINGQRTRPIPEGIASLAVADAMKKIEGMAYCGFLVTVHDRESTSVVRYVRPFIFSQDASETLAEAAIKQRFENENETVGGKP